MSIVLKTPDGTKQCNYTLEQARQLAPYLARGVKFVNVVEQPIDQQPLEGIGEQPTIDAPVAAKKPRYHGDDVKDGTVLIKTLQASGQPLSSGDLEAGTGIPSSVVRRLLHGSPMVVETGSGRGTRYAVRVVALPTVIDDQR